MTNSGEGENKPMNSMKEMAIIYSGKPDEQ